jgi:hypothetical protein
VLTDRLIEVGEAIYKPPPSRYAPAIADAMICAKRSEFSLIL